MRKRDPSDTNYTNSQKPKRHKVARSTEPNLENCARKSFDTKQQFDQFVASSSHYLIKDMGDTSALKKGFLDYQFAFHKPGTRTDATKAGWGMTPDQNIVPLLFDTTDLVKTKVDLKSIAQTSFGLDEGYMFVAPDRYKYQQVGPGFATEPDRIVKNSWRKNVHVDLREPSGEYQLACLVVVGKRNDPSRHMVITDLSILKAERKKLSANIQTYQQKTRELEAEIKRLRQQIDERCDQIEVFKQCQQSIVQSELNYKGAQLYSVLRTISDLKEDRDEIQQRENKKGVELNSAFRTISDLEEERGQMRERHLRICELMHAVMSTQTGKYDFNHDEKLLIRSALVSVEIKPGQALVFPQFFPHCLTESTTSPELDARALTVYVGIKMSRDDTVLESSQCRLVDLFAKGGQHVYQLDLGKNGFTDAFINQEHSKNILPCIFEQYNIPPICNGKREFSKGGFNKKHPFPTVSQFIQDVLAARKNPESFPGGMTCDHLNIDSILLSRSELKRVMEITRI